MTISLTYDDTEDLGRVRLSLSGYSTAADYALVERSLDQVTWETIRGGDTVPLSAGAGHVDDYEFTASTLNYYRVTAVDSADPSYVGVGTGASANNASVSPGLPAGVANGDLMILHASIRNSGAGTVNLPTGWTTITSFGNMLVAGRIKQSGDVAPTVTFAGGVANADTQACIFALRGSTLSNSIISTPLLNGSAQDIAVPASTFRPGDFVARFLWKQDDFSAVAESGWFNVYTLAATAGDDSGLAGILTGPWGTNSPMPSGTVTVTGGAAAISRAVTISIAKAPFTDQEINSITPSVSYYRIKNPSRPSLNIRVTPLDISEVSRTSRTGVFDVLGRTNPVSVSDVASSRRFVLTIDVNGYSAALDMDNRLALGEPMFLQPPIQLGAVPTCYFVIDGDCSFKEDTKGSGSYTVTIPAREVAKPGSTVYGDVYIWQDVITDFATWTAVLSGAATWSNLIDKISDNSIIVP